MAITQVQNKSARVASATSLDIVFDSVVASGNSIVVAIGHSYPGLAAVTDNKNSVYIRDQGNTATRTAQIHHSSPVVSGVKTVTVTAGSAAAIGATIFEYDKNIELDVAGKAAQTTGTLHPCGNITTTVPDTVIITSSRNADIYAGTPAPGFTEITEDFREYVQERISTSIETVDGAWTSDADSDVTSVIAAYKEIGRYGNIDYFIKGKDTKSNTADLFLTGVDNVNTSKDLFIQGLDNTILSTTLFVDGHELSTSLSDVFIEGSELVFASGDLIILGSQEVSNIIDLYIDALAKIYDSKSLFIQGKITTSGSSDLVISTKDVIQTSTDLFIEGYQPVSNSGNLTIVSHEIYTNSIDIFIAGQKSVQTSSDLFITGIVDSSGNTDNFINGKDTKSNTANLFLTGIDNINTSKDLLIQGLDNTILSTTLFIGGIDESSGVMSPSLFINGHNDTIVSADLFTYGIDQSINISDLFIQGIGQNTNTSDLFIRGITASGHNNTSTLFIGGMNIISDTVDLLILSSDTVSVSGNMYISGPIESSSQINLFISASGISAIASSFGLFINGMKPKPTLVCPALDPTASIQIKDSLITIYQQRIDALINQLGKNVQLEFTPIRGPCRNCEYDTIRKRSTGVYKSGGPRPFSRGRKCPWCKGRGFEETQATKCIKCLVKWNPQDLENFGISIGEKKGVVRFKTFLTEADDLIRAQTAVTNRDIEDQLKLRVKLIQGPIPVGLRERRYCISFWELI